LSTQVPKDEDCEHRRPQPVRPGWGLPVFYWCDIEFPTLLQVDTVALAMLPERIRNLSDLVTSIRHHSFCDLRSWRGLVAVLVATMYLLSGVLHGAHDIDVTSSSGGSEIASILDNGSAGHGDHKALGSHHCHGCFSVAVLQPLQATAGTELVAAPPVLDHPVLTGIGPDADSPPPKHLA